jgi:opacity protein-like surface antigen
MSRQQKLIGILAVAMASLSCAPSAFADDDVIAPLGLYVGASFGRANVRVDSKTTGSLFDFDEHHAGWKGLLGVRPLSALGAEVEYIDFGHPDHTIDGVRTDARARGVGAFAVGYLPIPIIDVFGKAGVARLQTIAHGTATTLQPTGEVCNNSSASCLFDTDHTDTRFAYGAGVQVKLARLGVRAEYERITANGADPSLLSVGLTYTF